MPFSCAQEMSVLGYELVHLRMSEVVVVVEVAVVEEKKQEGPAMICLVVVHVAADLVACLVAAVQDFDRQMKELGLQLRQFDQLVEVEHVDCYDPYHHRELLYGAQYLADVWFANPFVASPSFF